MKDVIDVPAREVKTKFLTGAPDWLDGLWGKVYVAVLAACAAFAVYSWLTK